MLNPTYLLLLCAFVCAVGALANRVHVGIAPLLLVILHLFLLFPVGK